jgi:K+-transporting ATPase KdpF subunit
MGFLQAVDQHLGLTALTVVSAVLVVYLVYSMVHPERY